MYISYQPVEAGPVITILLSREKGESWRGDAGPAKVTDGKWEGQVLTPTPHCLSASSYRLSAGCEPPYQRAPISKIPKWFLLSQSR